MGVRPQLIRRVVSQTALSHMTVCGGISSDMASAITVRHALTCTMLALLACGGGRASGQDSMPGEGAKTPSGGELMSQAEQDRRVDYIEFLTTDIEGTKRFYSEVFGWEFIDYGPEYTSFIDGRLGGGFALAPGVAEWRESGRMSDWASAAGGPLVVLYATNLEEIEASIRESGGRIVRETFEFPGGRRFHFTDPSGNELAVWSDQ